MDQIDSAADADDTSPEWETVLHPHRSLPPRGFFILMATLAAISFVSGIVFVSIGAWPVMGFFGIDVMLVYFAFRLNYRSARMTETLRLAGDDFTVERIGVRGERRWWRFQAFWLRVRLIDLGEDDNRLILSSHGRSLPVGGFLSPGERRDLACEVEGALARHRAA